MIARVWKGTVRTGGADDYAAYMRQTGLADYTSTPGNLQALMLRRELEDRQTEFLMLTLWESLEAVKAFAGEDYTRAVFYPDDDRFLVTRDLRVTHFDVDRPASRGETNR